MSQASTMSGTQPSPASALGWSRRSAFGHPAQRHRQDRCARNFAVGLAEPVRVGQPAGTCSRPLVSCCSSVPTEKNTGAGRCRPGPPARRSRSGRRASANARSGVVGAACAVLRHRLRAWPAGLAATAGTRSRAALERRPSVSVARHRHAAVRPSRPRNASRSRPGQGIAGRPAQAKGTTRPPDGAYASQSRPPWLRAMLPRPHLLVRQSDQSPLSRSSGIRNPRKGQMVLHTSSG